jgi:hypothetical protein
MRFMMLVKHAEATPPPTKELMDAMAKLTEDAVKNGSFITGGGLSAPAKSARVRLSRGQVRVMDGPFTEAKEFIGGFAILEFRSRKEAVKAAEHFMDLHRKHCPGWEGETEVREIDGPGAAAAK